MLKDSIIFRDSATVKWAEHLQPTFLYSLQVDENCRKSKEYLCTRMPTRYYELVKMTR